MADTTPLNYLILLDRIEILHDLYGRVLAPMAVRREMQHPKAPAQVRAWAVHSPAWLEWINVQYIDPSLPAVLDAGEREAISLALQKSADLLLVDELAGRRVAVSRNLRVTGTLAILAQVAIRDGSDFEAMLSDLHTYGFRASRSTVEAVLRRYQERKPVQ